VIAGLLFDIVSGTLAVKRHPASSKVTSGTGAAMQTKSPTATEGRNLIKKTAEKKDDMKKPPAKKDAPKSGG